MRALTILRPVLLSSALLLSDLFTIERMDSCPDERLPILIGMPLAHRTSIPWVNSMSGVLYVQGLLVNVTCWSVVLSVLGLGLTRMAKQRPRAQRFLRVSGMVLTVLATVFIGLYALGAEWNVAWSPEFTFRCPESEVRIMAWGAPAAQ